jgi:hypothetical protein
MLFGGLMLTADISVTGAADHVGVADAKNA